MELFDSAREAVAADIRGACTDEGLARAAEKQKAVEAQIALFSSMAGALSVCLDQIGQMRGLFGDEDGTIADAVRAAEEALGAFNACNGTAGGPGAIYVALSDRQHDAVLAGLRLLESMLERRLGLGAELRELITAIATNSQVHAGLSVDEIDALCLRINLAS